MPRNNNSSAYEEQVGLRSFLGVDSRITSRRPAPTPIQSHMPSHSKEPSQPRSSSYSRSFSSSLISLFLPRRSSDPYSSAWNASPTSSFGSTTSDVQVRPQSCPASGRPALKTALAPSRRGRPSLTKSRTSSKVPAASSRISWPLERDCEAASVWVSGYSDDGGADDRSRAQKLEARVDCRCRDCGVSERRRTLGL